MTEVLYPVISMPFILVIVTISFLVAFLSTTDHFCVSVLRANSMDTPHLETDMSSAHVGGGGRSLPEPAACSANSSN